MAISTIGCFKRPVGIQAQRQTTAVDMHSRTRNKKLKRKVRGVAFERNTRNYTTKYNFICSEEAEKTRRISCFSHEAHCELRWFSVEEPKRNDREDINIRSTLRYRYTVFPKYQRRI